MNPFDEPLFYTLKFNLNGQLEQHVTTELRYEVLKPATYEDICDTACMGIAVYLEEELTYPNIN